LIAFEHDGTFKWFSSVPVGFDRLYGRFQCGSPSIAETDQDGMPEIIFGSFVFNADGSLRWRANPSDGYGTGDAAVGPLSLVLKQAHRGSEVASPGKFLN
jgi:hypothetical protein